MGFVVRMKSFHLPVKGLELDELWKLIGGSLTEYRTVESSCTRVEEFAKKVCAMVLGLHARVIEQTVGPASYGRGFLLAVVCPPSQWAHLCGVCCCRSFTGNCCGGTRRHCSPCGGTFDWCSSSRLLLLRIISTTAKIGSQGSSMLYTSFLIATTVVKTSGGKPRVRVQLKLLGKEKQKQRERPDQSAAAGREVESRGAVISVSKIVSD